MDSVKMKGFAKLTRIDDALAKFFSQVKVERLPAEDVQMVEALGRILGEDVVAGIDVPGFDRSAVDGYALRAEETFGSSRTSPTVFEVIGAVEIGYPSKVALGKQQAMKIATGAAVPKGANAIVMIEFTEEIGEDRVEVYSSLTPGENVSKRGEDVKKGDRILSRGTLLRPQDLGILAALGISGVGVVRRPRVAVLSTGNELADLGESLNYGRITDSNRPILMAMVKELGGKPLDLGIVKDDAGEIRSRIARGIEEGDMVLVSGGTSVGAGDLVPEAISALGRPGVIVHGLCMRPGRPTALAAVDGRPVVLLPGFPVATMVSFNAVAQPILLKMLGAIPNQFEGRIIRARISRRIASSPGNRTFVRAFIRKADGKYVAEPLRTSGSGVISSMIRANGLVVIPEEKEGLEEGEEVEATLLRPLEE